jgi:predicted amidohydrolase YtcJ
MPVLLGAFDGFLRHLARATGTWSSAAPSISRRAFMSGSAALTGLAASLPTAGKAQTAPATIFTGGTILTVDGAFSEAEAIAIRGNRIIAVGSLAEVRAEAAAGAGEGDLAGRTLLPGFIDPHTHVVSGSAVDSNMTNVGMSRFGTAAEVIDHLRSLVPETAAGEWILARNVDPALQDGPDALTFAELDAVSTEVPVFVLNASGHLAYANRKAFEAAGIPENVADPPGAVFVRDGAGRLNGVMKNNVSFLQVVSAAPAMARLDPVSALVGLLSGWSRLGLTTMSELALGTLTSSPEDAGIIFAAAASGRLTARIRAYPFYTVGSAAWDAAGIVPVAGDALARISGYKLVADGSNQGFTGLQREPDLNSESRGTAYMTPEEMTATALDRAAKGWPLALHANGGAGIDMSRIRARIEHCSMLLDDQIARMKDLGGSASFLIGHVHFWGVWMRDRVFGPERVNHLGRCRSVEEADVGFTLHSDFMVTDPDPLHMIQMAVTRRTWKEPDFELNPAERVSVESAIRALTSEAAWQLFSEHEIGSLEVGKLADLVILEEDPRRVDHEAIRNIRVLETWMNGPASTPPDPACSQARARRAGPGAGDRPGGPRRALTTRQFKPTCSAIAIASRTGLACRPARSPGTGMSVRPQGARTGLRAKAARRTGDIPMTSLGPLSADSQAPPGGSSPDRGRARMGVCANAASELATADRMHPRAVEIPATRSPQNEARDLPATGDTPQLVMVLAPELALRSPVVVPVPGIEVAQAARRIRPVEADHEVRDMVARRREEVPEPGRDHRADLPGAAKGRHLRSVVHRRVRGEERQHLVRLGAVEVVAVGMDDIRDLRLVQKPLKATRAVGFAHAGPCLYLSSRRPPSTGRICPVIQPDRGVARKAMASAISSGRPQRGSG